MTNTLRTGLAAWLSVLLTVLSPVALAEASGPQLDQPLPPLAIAEHGELLLADGEYSWRPWDISADPGKVHIVQYFSGTLAHRKLFSPFTDRLQQDIDFRVYHVTTIINLDAALWGTKGFVMSEMEASKKQFPLATMVVDKDGIGEAEWSLKDTGAVLAIVDNDGIIRFVTNTTLDEAQTEKALELIRSEIDRAADVAQFNH